MKKDAFYFPHDSNAKDDPKITLLIDQLGLEGYGIFWVLIEILRDQPEYKYPLQLLPSIARKYATTYDKVKLVVFNYQLFSIENDMFFFSNSLIERMKPLENLRLQRKNAALRSLEARGLKPKNEQPLNDRSTTVEQPFNKVEESIREESKENNIINDADFFSKNAAPPKKTELFNSLKADFLEYFKNEKSENYYFTAKDAAAIKKIEKKLAFKVKEKKGSQPTENEIVDAFKYLLSNLKHKDDWIYNNLTLNNIDSQFNQIIIKIKENGHTNSKKTGCTDQQLAEILHKHINNQ